MNSNSYQKVVLVNWLAIWSGERLLDLGVDDLPSDSILEECADALLGGRSVCLWSGSRKALAVSNFDLRSINPKIE